MLSTDEYAAVRSSADTQPPSSTVHGEVLVVTADAVFEERAIAALRGSWRTITASCTALMSGSLLTSDVILLDPLGQRRMLERAIDIIARIRLRPSVILALRRPNDLEIAVRRCIGAVDVDVPEDIFQDAVLRTHRAQRAPRR
jgi:hypothetical protein